MSQQNALILRLVGPLIEIGCVLALRRFGDRGLTVAGLPVEYPLYAGLAAGLALVVAGLTLGRRPRPPGPRDLP